MVEDDVFMSTCADGVCLFPRLVSEPHPELSDNHLVGMELPAYYIFASCVKDMGGYRRESKYQCKEEHYC